MASSGVVTFSVNELDIVRDALEEIQVLGVGRTPKSAMIDRARRKLNMIVKQWAGSTDFAPGLKMWTRKRAYLFLQKGQHAYSLGPSGDHASESYVTTTLTANASLGASTITVASASGISSGQNIGILLNTGYFQWTTVNGAPAGSVVTLTATLTAAAASGARVFVYTSKMRRPLEVLTAVTRDTNSQDVAFSGEMILEQYEAIPDKTATGTADLLYYEAQLTNGVLYLNRTPDDVTKVIRLVYLSPPEDFTATTDTADFPQVWFRPLCLELAINLAPGYGFPVTPELKGLRDEALKIAREANPETSIASFNPHEEGVA